MKSMLLILGSFISLYTHAQKPFVIKTNSQNGLVPEGIAVDTRTGIIYISSIAKHKIIAVDRNGKCADFIKQDQDGFLEGLGMKIDKKRNWLWAISVTTAPRSFTSKVYAFNLASAKQEQVYTLTDTIPHMFNDLDIDENGNLYITDTYYSAVYFVNTEKKKMELFLKVPEIKYPNGIAVGKNNQLYTTTYENGLAKIDITSKSAILLKGFSDSVIVRGLDGLVFSKNSLIGVYNYSLKKNSFDTALVIKYTLNKTGDRIINEEIIDKGNSNFFQPTTLALSNKQLLVLANSHLDIYNNNKQSTVGKEDQLKPITILRYKLK